MADLVYCATNILFFDIPLSYYYINLNTIYCLSSGDLYLSFGISVLLSTVSRVLCSEVCETFVILFSILLSIKLPVVSAFF